MSSEEQLVARRVLEPERDELGQEPLQSGGSAEDLYSTTTPDTSADPSGEVTSYTYYPGGQTDTTTTPAGVTTDVYDASGDLHTATYSSTGTGYSVPTNDTYTYNTDGTLHTMADGTGTTTYVYDANADVSSITNGTGLELSYGYYPVGDLGSVTYPNSDSVTYAYNALGEESSLTDWLSKTTSFGYDSDGLLKTATLPNGITETTAYDNADQASSITDTDGSTTVASFDYDRDPNNNLTSETDTGTPGPSSQSYTYDTAMRVKTDGSSSYNYDAASDLTTGPGGATQSFNGAGQLCWSMASPPGGSTCASDPSGSTTYSYDSAGDRTATTAPASTSSYTWDQNLKLTSATSPAGTVDYGYNGAGELSSRTTGGSSANLVWDPVGMANPVLVDDGANYYIYGPDALPTEQISVASGTVDYYLHDQLGSTRALTSSSGAVVGSWTYNAWGGVVASTGGTGTPTPTISAVGSLASNAGNGVTTLSVDPSHVGDALLAVVKVSSATTTVSSLSGGGATGWSKLESYADGSHDNEIRLGTVTTTGSATLTATFSASVSGVDVDFNAQEFTAGLGSGTTWSKDTGSGQSNSAGSTFDFPSLTPAGTGELYFGYARGGGTTSGGGTSGFSYPPHGRRQRGRLQHRRVSYGHPSW